MMVLWILRENRGGRENKKTTGTLFRSRTVVNLRADERVGLSPGAAMRVFAPSLWIFLPVGPCPAN